MESQDKEPENIKPEIMPAFHSDDPLGEAIAVLDATAEILYQVGVNYIINPSENRTKILENAYIRNQEAFVGMVGVVLKEDETDYEKAILLSTLYIDLDEQRVDFLRRHSQDAGLEALIEQGESEEEQREALIDMITKLLDEDTDEIIEKLSESYSKDVAVDFAQVQASLEDNTNYDTAPTLLSHSIDIGKIALATTIALCLYQGINASLRIAREGKFKGKLLNFFS